MEVFISSNIKYLRLLCGDGQGGFGKKFGLTRDNIASYERGAEPKIEIISRMVNYFHIRFEDLIHIDLSKSKGIEIKTKDKGVLKTKGDEFVTLDNNEYKTKGKDNVTNTKGDKKGDILNKNQKYKNIHPFEENTGGCMVQDKMQDFRLLTDRNIENQNIPLYNIEAAAGLVPLFNDTNNQKPLDFITIPNLPKCDGAIHVTGDSMYPLLKSGDIVLYKQINDLIANIFWGEMYLISIDMEGEEYVTVKYIQKSGQDNYIKLVSHNQHHSDKEVHISKVRALAFIKASIRINSMK